MSRIPCRKCNGCGLYHDLTVTICGECGKDISAVPALLIETEEIPAEHYGEISEDITVYAQKCSACGALNFTSDPNRRVRVCYNCHKARVASITPTIYAAEQKQARGDADQNDAAETVTSNGANEGKTVQPMIGDAIKRGSPASNDIRRQAGADDDDEDEDDDGESAAWGSLLGNVRKALDSSADHPNFNDDRSRGMLIEETAFDADCGREFSGDDDDDEDDEASDWSGILSGTGGQKKKQLQQEKPGITLTALRYGRLSFTIQAESDSPYLLGRAANQSAFLSNDGRVGNEHCYLIFKNGKWHVKDNHSSNGTAVNARDIGLNGEQILSDGDELKLGHHPDSMAFRITID